jgi:hypothetical protein
VRVNNANRLRATPHWDDGKVLGWRQYEVAQEKPDALVALELMPGRN